MRINIRTALLALSLFAASCSDVADGGGQPAKRTISVSVGSGPEIDIETQSRTALDPDGVSVKWVPGDKIALWAIDGSNNATLAAHPFTLWHYNEQYNAAKFTADIPVMAEGEYTYCAVSPTPAAIDGTRASYDIPAVQEGLFNGACDVMVATPIRGEALREGDNSGIINFEFSHKVHVLKIRIPENKMEMPVSKLEMVFPVPVTGRLTVDATNPDAAPALTEGSNTLTLNFAQPIDVGATVFAVIAPLELTSADEITIKAYSGKKESYPTTMRGKNFEQAHTTPIALTIPEQHRVTHIVFSLNGDGTQTLGEKVNSFTLTSPAGVDLGNGTNTRAFAVNEQNQYTISYEGVFNDNLSNQQLTVAYDSDNAVVSNKLTMPQIIADELNDQIPAFEIPYLFAEDFSNVTNQDWSSGWSGTDPSSSTNATQLDASQLTGWTGARVGVQGGNSGALRISCNFLTALWSNMVRPGRIDTRPLQGVKNPVKVKVSYTYCGDYFIGVGSGGNIRVSAGYTTQSGAINSTEGISNIIIPETSINKDFNDGNAHYDMAGKHASPNFVIPSCTASTRLSWRVTTDRKGAMGGNGCYWIYIDNIKVSIAQ